jgi:two-component system nitrogen regulation sensor histidine kinase NtrY
LYLVATLLLILTSIIVGIGIAQRIVNPISSIIKASNKISKGNYDDKVERTNDYIELNRLADSFNKMSNDLVRQRNQLAIAKKYETWSDIARRIAHEIKNPLTPIQLSSERLLKKIKNTPNYNDKEIHECVNSITRQVSEIGLLVDEFSNFARLPNPEFRDLNIYSLLNNCITDIKNNYNNIDFDLILENDKFILKCDKNQITRVIHNILINSINSINELVDNKPKGNIVCKTTLEDNMFIIQIVDNGSGLKYNKDELIKPYFTTRKKTGGTGLGLPIVEKILSDHNADFELTNRIDGSTGAVASIYFNLN